MASTRLPVGRHLALTTTCPTCSTRRWYVAPCARRIVSIDTSKAEALPGVKAVASADFPEMSAADATKGTAPCNFVHLSQNVMARGKALYDGHAVAAVAATSMVIARKAAALVEVEYEVLPHVIEVDEAIADDAPVLHDDMFTAGIDPKPEAASNVAKRVEFSIGDLDAGFAQADVVVELGVPRRSTRVTLSRTRLWPTPTNAVR